MELKEQCEMYRRAFLGAVGVAVMVGEGELRKELGRVEFERVLQLLHDAVRSEDDNYMVYPQIMEALEFAARVANDARAGKVES